MANSFFAKIEAINNKFFTTNFDNFTRNKVTAKPSKQARTKQNMSKNDLRMTVRFVDENLYLIETRTLNVVDEKNSITLSVPRNAFQCEIVQEIITDINPPLRNSREVFEFKNRLE